MGERSNKIRLYSSQSQAVTDCLAREGRCFSKREYVAGKYGESAPIFLAAYDWFVKAAERLLPKPEGAQYPYWAFGSLLGVDTSAGGSVLTLEVDPEEAVFFYRRDWVKILCLQYIGETEEEEAAFKQELEDWGVRQESDVVLTNFYPDFKRRVTDSWNRLFRFHHEIQRGQGNWDEVQAGLWMLKREYVAEGS